MASTTLIFVGLLFSGFICLTFEQIVLAEDEYDVFQLRGIYRGESTYSQGKRKFGKHNIFFDKILVFDFSKFIICYRG